MSNSTPTHSLKLISERKKKKTEREENQEIGPVVHAERERERERSERIEDKGHGVDIGARRLARSNSSEGQRVAAMTEGGWVEKNLRCGFNFQSKRI